jgi:hypothetical protein
VGGSVADGGAIESCPPGYSLCSDGGCYYLPTDPSNCGFCGNNCGNGVCDAGSCIAPTCVGCAEYITNGGTICDGQSLNLYDALVNCTCAGKCLAQCTDNVCVGQPATNNCQNCVIDSANGCGNEFGECSNDF